MTHNTRMTTRALCIRTEMVGGGTSYRVYWPKEEKPSEPLYGRTYATIVMLDGREYYYTTDAIMRRDVWSNLPYDGSPDSKRALHAYWHTSKVAERLDLRVARRAFPELRDCDTLPSLWADWTLPSQEVWVNLDMALPA